MITNGGSDQSAVEPAPSGAKTSAASQRSYTSCSNAAGAYALGSSRSLATGLASRTPNDPLVQRTNGVVVPPAGAGAGAIRSSRAQGPASLAARYRAPPATARERPSVRDHPRG